MAAHLNATVKYVATRTLRRLDWPNARILDGGLQQAVEGLKSQGDGNIAVLGSGELVAELRTRDFADEYRLFLHPLLLGTGKRLFRERSTPQSLSLKSCATTTGVLLTYTSA
jgi:dihydrofolate reductase